MKIGYMLASEQFTPAELIDQARRARDAGFEALSISDHFHPWNDDQGQSAFVWSMIGALSQAVPELPVSTMVTCPTIRVHPVVLAQAAATSAVMLEGRFVFGVGSGENLNEHVTGERWPSADERMERLREAVSLIRRLWEGANVDFEGKYYRAVNARIYTLPETPPPIYVSAFGPVATRLAAEIGDGFVTMDPDLVKVYRDAGGRGTIQTAYKACYSANEREGAEIAHRMWATELLPGQLNQELPTPHTFEAAITLVEPDAVAEQIPCGPDVGRHCAALAERASAGYDEIYVQQVGPDMDGFFKLYADEVLPQVRRAKAA